MSFRTFVCALLLLVSTTANAGDKMEFSRAASIQGDGQELTVADGTAWKISYLPSRSCPLGKSCPAVIITGKFKVGDDGDVREGEKVGLTSQQLSSQPLWILAGSTVVVPEGASSISVQEHIASLAKVKDEVPVVVNYRKSMLGNGLVAIFTNRGDKYLNLIVTIQNQKAFRVDLAPGQVQEIGHMEGWAFQYGELINIRSLSNDYSPINIRM